MDANRNLTAETNVRKANTNDDLNNEDKIRDKKTLFKKMLRGVEFILLFFGIPLLIYSESLIRHPSLVLLPVLAGLILYFILKKDFNIKSLVRLDVPPSVIWKNIVLVLLTGLFLIGFVYLYAPENLFNLPRENPEIWLFLIVAYPIFSAYSQEVVYRTFLFTRYRDLFRNRNFLIFISGVTFAFAHIVYHHPLSMILTLFAGTYLAWIYRKTRSVLFTAILHSLLGLMVFSVGLGEYFWLNMERHL